MRKLLSLYLLCCSFPSHAQSFRWALAGDGAITWTLKDKEVHTDHIEMSGRRISAIVTYGCDSLHQLVLSRQLVFPMLRTVPNNTHASLKESFSDNIVDSISV